jgi:hypothetical protein
MVTDPLDGAVLNEVRDFADRSVEQAKRAFGGFIGVVNAAIQSEPAQSAENPASAAELSRLAVGFAGRNVQGAFELAHSMVHATDLAQMLELQREFLETQMKALRREMRTLGKATQAGHGGAEDSKTAEERRLALRS